METENRKLIKFSNYSLCVTLPKLVIKRLKWGKGDIVRLVVNEDKGEILIRKGLRIPKIAEAIKSEQPKPKTKSNVKKPGKARW